MVAGRRHALSYVAGFEPSLETDNRRNHGPQSADLLAPIQALDQEAAVGRIVRASLPTILRHG